MIKPILFNTDMVRAILAGRKTVTRRVVKPPLRSECDHGGQHKFIRDDFIEGTDFTGFVCKKCGYGVCGPHFKFPVGSSWIRPPYRPGDILYVREAFQQNYDGSYSYRAGHKFESGGGWRPSIHMPREAARIFLRVTDVRVERLRDITEEQAKAEGACNGFPFDNYIDGFKCSVWNNTIKLADRDLYGWEVNPWVWVIEFERCEKPKEA